MPKRDPQDSSADCADITALLPFYLNRSLEVAEARRVEAHLATCEDCRLQERETRTAAALYEGHLPVELLLDYALESTMPTRVKEVVESHLAACERCAEEVATVQQEPSPLEDVAVGPAADEPWVAGDRDPTSSSAEPTRLGHLRTLAWAASLAAVIASAGWFWTWRQLADQQNLGAVTVARVNVAVAELLPSTEPILRRGAAETPGTANQVPLPADADELVLVLLAGGRSCESGCVLELYEVGASQPAWQVEGVQPSPDGHVTLVLPRERFPRRRSILAVRNPNSDELVAEYLVEGQVEVD